jgi:hypothetical protein
VEILEDRMVFNLSFGPANVLSMPTGASGPTAVAGGLFSGANGLGSFASANSGTNNVTIFLSNGDGTFKTTNPVAGTGPSGIVTGDVNNDGNPDLLVNNGGSSSSRSSVIKGNGNGTFVNVASPSFGPGMQDTSSGVFTSSGLGDVIASYFNGVGIEKNTGNFVFTGPTLFPAGSSGGDRGLGVGDFNKDGNQDIAVANHTDKQVYLLEGNGNGTFKSAGGLSFSTDSAPEEICVGDFNGDGKLDMAVTTDAGKVDVFLGNGDGTFKNEVPYSVGSSPVGIASADFREAGKTDLVVSNSNGTVSILLSNGDGTFASQITFSTGGTGSSHNVAVADVNGDGQPDIEVANSVSGTVSVLTNETQVASFTFSGVPASMAAGSSFNMTVTALDGSGNVSTNYVGTVTFTSTDTNVPFTVLPANYQFTAADAGVHTFPITLSMAGTQTVTVTDAKNGAKNTTSGITVTAGATALFSVTGPNSTTAGVAQTFSVQSTDMFGNATTDYTGTAMFSSGDTQANLPGPYTFTGADQGLHTFPVTFKTAGNQALVVTDSVTSSMTGSAVIQVTPAAASTFTTTIAGTATAGIAHNITVTAFDPFNNVATAYNGTVLLSSSTDANATFVPNPYTFQGGDDGVHTFAATFELAGSNSVTVTDTSNSSVTGTSTGINVVAAAAKSLVVSGFPASTVAGVAQSFTVTALDQFGNVATGYGGTVKFASSDSQATVPHNFSFDSANQGTANFSATLRSVTGPAGQSLTATDVSNSSITGTQSGITVTPAAASSLTLSSIVVTAGIAGNFTVTAYDPFGNVATGYLGTVHLTTSDSQGSITPSSYTFKGGDNGVHTFSATLKTAPTQTVTAKDTVNASITGTVTDTVTPAAAASLTLTGPGTTTAGVAQSFTLTAKDQFGNVATGYLGTVAFTSSDANAVLPGNYTFGGSDAGVHVFSIVLKTVGGGSQSVTATDAANSLSNSTSTTVNPAAVASLNITGFSTTTAGVGKNVLVKALDAFGNIATSYRGTVHFSSTDPSAGLPANSAFTAGNAGQHNFTVTLKSAGTRTVTVVDTVNALLTSSFTATVTAATAQTLSVTDFPATTTAGVRQVFNVTALDAFNNIATGYRGTVTVTSSDPKHVLPGNYTFLGSDNGTHAFTAILETAGTQSITATDTVTATITGSETGIVVIGAAAKTLTISNYVNATAGTAQSVTVKALDAFGNVAIGYRGTVSASSTDPQASLPGNYTFTNVDAGVHSFSVTMKTAGSQTLTFSDVNSPPLTVSQSATISPASATTLGVTGFPTATTAGVPQSFTVTALDAFGNVVTTYGGTVSFTTTNSQFSLPGPYHYLAGDNGTHTFSGTLKTAATSSISASDGTISGSETGIVVSPASAKTLTVSGFSTTAGVAQNFTVTAVDPFGNTATGYVGKVNFSSSDDPQAGLPIPYTFGSGDQGTHTFSATFKTAGTRTLTATDANASSITGSASISVSPASASTLSITGSTAATAGAGESVTVTAFDPFGNIATGYLGSVNFTSSDPSAVFPATYTFKAADHGSHTISVTFKTTPSQSITGTDGSNGSITGSLTVSVNPGTATSLTMSTYPSSTSAGISHNVTVTLFDAFNNVATSYTGTVQFSSSDAQAGLPAQYDFGSSDAGTHTFSVTLKTAGSQSITAADTVNGSITATQSGITVLASSFAQFAVTGVPSPTGAGVAQPFTVTAEDAFGNLVTGYQGTASFSSSDVKAVLPGNYTFTGADNGVHTFPVVSNTGGAEFITAGTESLTATDLASSFHGSQTGIVVTPGPFHKMTLSYPKPVVAGTSNPLVVTLLDTFGNVATAYTGTVNFTTSDTNPNVVIPSPYAFTAADAGTHTFSATLITATTTAFITATDSTHPSIKASVKNITVKASAAVQLTMTGLPATGSTSTAVSFVVTAFDVWGNVATGFTDKVQISTGTSTTPTTPFNYTFTSGTAVGKDNGQHTFSLLFNSTGTFTVTATDLTNGSVTSSSQSITISWAPTTDRPLTDDSDEEDASAEMELLETNETSSVRGTQVAVNQVGVSFDKVVMPISEQSRADLVTALFTRGEYQLETLANDGAVPQTHLAGAAVAALMGAYITALPRTVEEDRKKQPMTK